MTLSSGTVHIFCFLVAGFGGGNEKHAIYIHTPYICIYYTFDFF